MRILILQDHKENRRKCTLTPLEACAGIRLVRLPRPPTQGRAPAPVEIEGGVLLHIGGSPLSPADRVLVESGPIILIDSTWLRVENVLRRVRLRGGGGIVRRALPGPLISAYPRASKLRHDPGGGLASVEALYAASLVLGEPRPDLLENYRWKDAFLERNRGFLARYAQKSTAFGA